MRLPTAVRRVPVYVDLCLCTPRFGVTTSADTFVHARALWVEGPAGPMHHVSVDESIQAWLRFPVWDLGANYPVHLGWSSRFVTIPDHEQQMTMR
eukprot:5841490-Pyramimonas_sp.AAC.4